jgi:hypothetical protein
MSKAGKTEPGDVGRKMNLIVIGSQHPSPERIPHSIPAQMLKKELTHSPVKESGLTQGENQQ